MLERGKIVFSHLYEKEVDIVLLNLLILFIKRSFVGFKQGMIVSCAVTVTMGHEATE